MKKSTMKHVFRARKSRHVSRHTPSPGERREKPEWSGSGSKLASSSPLLPVGEQTEKDLE